MNYYSTTASRIFDPFHWIMGVTGQNTFSLQHMIKYYQYCSFCLIKKPASLCGNNWDRVGIKNLVKQQEYKSSNTTSLNFWPYCVDVFYYKLRSQKNDRNGSEIWRQTEIFWEKRELLEKYWLKMQYCNERYNFLTEYMLF